MTGPSHELQTLKAEFFRALAHPTRIRLLEIRPTDESLESVFSYLVNR